MDSYSFFHIIYYSFYTLEGNYVELVETIKQFLTLAASDEALQSTEYYTEISLYGSREISRRLHNYVAAWFSIREHAYRILDKLKKSDLEWNKFLLEDYKKQVDTYFKDSTENSFIQDLRNYTQHNQLPVPTLALRLSKNNIEYSFKISTSKLLKSDNWSPSSKKFLKEQGERFVLDELLDRHFCLTKDFYLRVRFCELQLQPSSPLEIKHLTFEEWKESLNK